MTLVPLETGVVIPILPVFPPGPFIGTLFFTSGRCRIRTSFLRRQLILILPPIRALLTLFSLGTIVPILPIFPPGPFVRALLFGFGFQGLFGYWV